jgi:hypothetical protein
MEIEQFLQQQKKQLRDLNPHGFALVGFLNPGPESHLDKKLDPDLHLNQCGSTTFSFLMALCPLIFNV